MEQQFGYIYTYACHEEERSLCRLELRTLFGIEPYGGFLQSLNGVDPSRSPFIKQQLRIMVEGDSVEEISRQVKAVNLQGATFKVVFLELGSGESYEEKRAVERLIGGCMLGQAEMRRPDRLFGITNVAGRWLFGECRTNQALWLRHARKPQNYSTALSTRVVRAVANIAVPQTIGVKAIDPCCGIGTVLIEALSMGIDIVGSDRNPLAVRGARVNLSHFGLPDVVRVADMRTLSGSYDAAILDLPYNLCSVISVAEQGEMLASARRLANRLVVVATESLDALIEHSGFTIVDRGEVRKGSFVRQIVVCE